MGDCMHEIGAVIVKRCMNIIIMFFPSLLWGTLIMYDICFGVSHLIFKIASYTLQGMLILSMLFMNKFLSITFKEEFRFMQYELKKPNWHDLLEAFIIGLPLVLILFFTPIWLFLLYGVIQFFYILADHEHMSIMERLYAMITKSMKSCKENHLRKKKQEKQISSS